MSLNSNTIRELTVISGKGGTGKTSIAASFALLAERPVVADCDVDAADLHLLLSPEILKQTEFRAGNEARIVAEKCIGCGLCRDLCRFDAIDVNNEITDELVFKVEPTSCEGCGVCKYVCPADAIEFNERSCGEWMVSNTRCGPMVHAKLGVAGETSGKLVSLVRREAHRIAESNDHSTIIVDGPPGIGCPVIASITGATDVLVVTEPTVSGEHDLERVLALTHHFNINTAICVNKWDINPDMTKQIEDKAEKSGARVVGRIRYDRSVTLAQMQTLAIVETDSPCADEIRSIWRNLIQG